MDFFFVHHSQIFWFGDLNYRISMLDVEVRKLVALKKWDELMNNDQVSDMKPKLCTVQFILHRFLHSLLLLFYMVTSFDRETYNSFILWTAKQRTASWACL